MRAARRLRWVNYGDSQIGCGSPMKMPQGLVWSPLMQPHMGITVAFSEIQLLLVHVVAHPMIGAGNI